MWDTVFLRKWAHLDFIERCFHISPDGGSGTTEAIYVSVVIAIVVVALQKLLKCRRNVAIQTKANRSLPDVKS